MKLNDFIKDAVVQIIQGINAADSDLKELASAASTKINSRRRWPKRYQTSSIVRGSQQFFSSKIGS